MKIAYGTMMTAVMALNSLIIPAGFAVVKTVTSAPVKADNLKGTITISGAWALYPMAVKWSEEFKKIHPNVRIDISAGGAGKGMADALAGVVDVGMVSREVTAGEIKKGAWWVSVTKDAVVPVVSENNPHLKTLLARGVNRDTFVNIWITEKVATWGQVAGTDDSTAINVYTRSDSCGAAETWAKYLGKTQEDLAGVGVFGDPGLANAVRKDNLGIGYNNVNFVYDPKTKKAIEGVKILPVDLNGNGKIDTDEEFYSKREDLLKAIGVGKYPSPPARNLHFVCKARPTKKEVAMFLKWVLTDGQKFAPDAGYICLADKKLKAELKKLDGK